MTTPISPKHACSSTGDGPPARRANGERMDMTIGLRRHLLAATCGLLLAGCASHGVADAPAAAPPAVPEIGHGLLMGYVAKENLPDSLALLPPPPATAFSCALGVRVDEANTPRLYQLLRRTLTDAGLSTYGAKNKYQRARPFMSNQQPICTEDDRAFLLKDGSYPSGHTAIGWAWALILAEMSPAQANALLARGLAFGESRNICNVHWHSDVQQGLVMGAAAVARVRVEPEFQRDFLAAQKELAVVRSNGSATPDGCAAQ